MSSPPDMAKFQKIALVNSAKNSQFPGALKRATGQSGELEFTPERERERERQRDTERDRDRETERDRQTDTHTGRHARRGGLEGAGEQKREGWGHGNERR